MKRKTTPTIFLKIAVILIAMPVLALSILWLPSHADYLGYPVIIGVYATAVAFFFALYQALKLLGYIDNSKAFSETSVSALKCIKYCAVTISIIYAGIMPLLFPIADKDDAPGLLLVPLIPIFASSVIAVFVAVLEKLLREAIDIIDENDLTI